MLWCAKNGAARRGTLMNAIQNLWKWVREQVVGDVPEGDAVCEFDCRNHKCTMGEWENCDRRLHRGAGEFMPATNPEARSAIGERAGKASDPPVADSSI
jgi:hypothetical protein